MLEVHRLYRPQRVLCRPKRTSAKKGFDFSALFVKGPSQWPVFQEAFPAPLTPCFPVTPHARIHHICPRPVRNNAHGSGFRDVVDGKDKMQACLQKSSRPCFPMVRGRKISEFTTFPQPCVVRRHPKRDAPKIQMIRQEDEMDARGIIGAETDAIHRCPVRCTGP